MIRIEVFGIPTRMKGKTLDGLQGLEREVHVAKEAIEEGRSVFITGGCGSGKTHLACGLLKCRHDQLRQKEGIEGPLKFMFVSASELLLELRATFAHDGDMEAAVIDRYSWCDLLIIDDLGAEKVTDWSRQMLCLLFDRRYRECKQTITTSNLTLDDLANVSDDRISSRFLEMGAVVDLGMEDFRIKCLDREIKVGK